MIKKISSIVIGLMLVLTAVACESKADVASRNISTAADNFEVPRRVLFYNGITGDIAFEIDGFCSLGNNDPSGEVSVTCKVGPSSYVKEFLGLSDNMTYMAIQAEGVDVSTYRYRVIFRPTTLIPGVELDK